MEQAGSSRVVMEEEDLVPQLHCWYKIVNKDQS